MTLYTGTNTTKFVTSVFRVTAGHIDYNNIHYVANLLIVTCINAIFIMFKVEGSYVAIS